MARVGPASGEPRIRGLTIGEAATRLALEFPGLRPDTLRVLERRGLLEPRRTPSGYRRYTERDLDAVRRVLSPAEPPAPGAPPLPSARPAAPPLPPAAPSPAPPRPRAERAPAVPVPAPSAPELGATADNSGASRRIRPFAAPDTPAASVPAPTEAPAGRRRPPRWPDAEYFAPELGEVALAPPGLARAAGLEEHRVAELAGYGLISGADPATGADLLVARAAADLLDYGIEPRHLRPVVAAAGRAAALIRAAGGGAARVPAAPAAAALVRLEAALLRAALLDD